MAAVIVKVQMKGATEVIAMLSGVRARAVDLTPAMKRAGTVMLASVDKNFRGSGRPRRWKALSPSYLKRKIAAGYSPKPLVRSGARGLQGSVNSKAQRRKLLVGTPIIYGPTHQFGRGGIPARPYLVFQTQDLRDIERLVVEHITKGDRHAR